MRGEGKDRKRGEAREKGRPLLRALAPAALALCCFLLGSAAAYLTDRGGERSGNRPPAPVQEEAAGDTKAPGEESTQEEPAGTAAAVQTSETTEKEETDQGEKIDPGLLETGEDYVAMERAALDHWAESLGMTVEAQGDTVTYTGTGISMRLTVNDAGNCVLLTGTAEGTGEEQYAFFSGCTMFVLTGDIYHRCEDLLLQVKNSDDPEGLSLCSASPVENGVEIRYTESAGAGTLTIDRPDGGPFLEF